MKTAETDWDRLVNSADSELTLSYEPPVVLPEADDNFADDPDDYLCMCLLVGVCYENPETGECPCTCHENP